MEVISKYNSFIKRNPDPFLNTGSVAKIALLWPQQASNYYKGSSVPLTDFTKAMSAEKGGNLSEEFYGFYDGLSRNHFPFDVLDEEALENNLGKYDLIILPNVPCFTKEAANKIKDFVRDGGNIVATFETSLYNENGEKLKDFQLKDVFGLENAGDVFGPLNYDYVSVKDQGNFSLRGIKQKNTYAPTFGLKLKAQAKAKVPVFFCKPLAGSYAGKPEATDTPFIIENNYGKGRSVYFAGTFGGSLDKFHFPEYYQIVFNLVSGLSEPVVKLEDAPSSIEVNVRRKGNSIFLYLINFTSDMRRPIQEIISCRNIKIRLFMKEKVKSIKALWIEKNLEFAQKGDSISFALPVIEDYEIMEIKI
jgi:beta-galactosidase GanA